MKTGFYIKTILITGVVLICLYFAGVFIKHVTQESHFKKFTAKIERVIDGDTVVLDDQRHVRLVGIDSPETNHPDQPVQRYGEEAKKYLKQRIEGKTCVLEYETTNEKDVYGRTLAMIFLDGDNINAEMIKQGLAYAYVKDPNSRTKDFAVLENIAKKFRKGLWMDEAGGQVKK
jgi:micrococcal nuclease